MINTQQPHKAEQTNFTQPKVSCIFQKHPPNRKSQICFSLSLTHIFYPKHQPQLVRGDLSWTLEKEGKLCLTYFIEADKNKVETGEETKNTSKKTSTLLPVDKNLSDTFIHI